MNTDEEDVRRLTTIALALELTAPIAVFVVDGQPHAKKRPRFRVIKGRQVQTYPDPADVAAEKLTAAAYRGNVDGVREGNVGFVCLFYRRTRGTVDGDNLMKHAKDAGKGVLWVDDAQVTAEASVTEYDPDRPRTVVLLGDHESTMLRGLDAHPPCAACGDPVPTPRTVRGLTTCTVRCEKAIEARDQGVLL